MSLTDDVRVEARPSGPSSGGSGQPASQFDKTPPQDIAAEQCVLGGMLLSKDAIADVVEILKSADFYRPVHATVFDAILDLYGRGEPADPITVAAALADSGDLGRVGGAPYLHTLIASVPTAANAAYYARIVAERAVLRRLVEAGTRIVQLGYGSAAGGGRDVDDIVDLAQQAVYDVTERRVSEDFAVLADMLQPTLDEIEAVGAQGGFMTGVPTGFTDLDRLLNGLHPGQLIVVAGRPGLGKALALDTPLPTPDGWTTMGQIKAGDRLLGADGRPATVVATSPVMRGQQCYELEFCDGSVIVADGSHLWATRDRQARRRGHPAQVRTTEEIAGTLRTDTTDRHLNHSVANASPLDLPPRQLPIPPYPLGVWLADNASAAGGFTVQDPEIVCYLEEDMTPPAESLGSRVLLPEPLLRAAGVFGDRHIPGYYLRASEAQRRSLLAGLLDVGGTVAPTGTVDYYSTSRRLAEGVHELIVSLGYGCTMATGTVPVTTSACSTVHVLTFSAPDDVFRLERKRLEHKTRRRTAPSVRADARFIVDVRPVPSVPVKCVSIDNEYHLYLAGRDMIPTHNSTASLDFARNAAIRHNCASAVFSLEMSKVEIVMRLLSAEARVPLHVLRSGQLSDDDWTKLARRMGEISEAPLFVDDTPNMNLMEIRAKARRLKQRHDLKMVVVDYLQLMTSPKRTESRQQEVAELSRGLKLLAKEVECPVIAVSQLNRGPEQRTDKRPQLSDLRESGCMTEDTTLLRADTGAPITFGELLRNGHNGTLVWSVDEHRHLVPAPVTAVFPSGVKPTFRLRLASGREVTASGNHPFLTFDGWRRLDELGAGDRVAIPRRIPAPTGAGLDWSPRRIGLLAHLIGDGCVIRKQAVHYTSQDEANLAFVEEAAAAEFGITPRRVRQGNWTRVYLPAPYQCRRGRGNPSHAWFRELGICSRRSYEKRIPDAIYTGSNDQVAHFLRHLWATDGCVWWPVKSGTSAPKVYYASASRGLADGVAALLARFGIVARIGSASEAGYRPNYHVIIADGPSQANFCREIGLYGARGAPAEQLLALVSNRPSNTNVDTLPIESWHLVKAQRVRAGVTERQLQSRIGMKYCGSTLYKSCPSRERISRLAEALDSDVLRAAASDDIFWDRVAAIEPQGERPVYDATVKDTHSFVADGVIAHNSIEQDADVVILLHRDDYYDKESPRAGEADFIVAKHRNGPTDTVTVAAQLHLSRFVDMAI